MPRMVALGHLSTATDGHLTQYVYDGRNQLIEQTNPHDCLFCYSICSPRTDRVEPQSEQTTDDTENTDVGQPIQAWSVAW